MTSLDCFRGSVESEKLIEFLKGFQRSFKIDIKRVEISCVDFEDLYPQINKTKNDAKQDLLFSLSKVNPLAVNNL